RRFENVATPADAVTIVVPVSVAALGPEAIAIVIEFVAIVTLLPNASWTDTSGAGLIGVVASTWLGGATSNASFAAAAAEMSNAVLVAPASPPAEAESVYPTAAFSMVSPANEATPLTAATVVVPASVAFPGLAAIDTVTLTAAVETRRPD